MSMLFINNYCYNKLKANSNNNNPKISTLFCFCNSFSNNNNLRLTNLSNNNSNKRTYSNSNSLLPNSRNSSSTNNCKCLTRLNNSLDNNKTPITCSLIWTWTTQMLTVYQWILFKWMFLLSIIYHTALKLRKRSLISETVNPKWKMKNKLLPNKVLARCSPTNLVWKVDKN